MPRPNQRQIYRRRRALALSLVILLAGAVWGGSSLLFQVLNIQSSGQEIDQSDGQASASSSPGEFPECDSAQIELLARVGDADQAKETFSSEELPMLWFEIVSKAAEPCTFNVGSSVTFFTITSGSETIWSSRQCNRSGDSDLIALLEPGESKRAQASEWLRVRSSQSGGCGEGQPEVVAGGASYHLKVEVNGVISQNDQQFLLY